MTDFDYAYHMAMTGKPPAPPTQADEVRELRRELAEAQQAIGLLTTLNPTMQIDILHPVDMAYQIVDHVKGELAEAQSKALRYDLDRAGIDHRDAEAVELVECRARLAEAQTALKDYVIDYSEVVATLRRELAEARAALRDVDMARLCGRVPDWVLRHEAALKAARADK